MKKDKGITAFLFDFDGTVANTLPAIRATLEHTAREMDLPLDTDRAFAMIGTPLIDMGQRLCGADKKKDFLETYTRINTLYALKLSSPYEGMEDVLASLKKDGKSTAIVTSRRYPSLRELLDSFNLGDCFDFICTKESAVKCKPNPEPVQFTLNNLGIPPENAVMIGDTMEDILAGKSAGTATVGVAWGINGKALLKKEASPDYMADTPEELLQILKSLY